MRVWAEKEECGIFIWQMDKSMQTNQSIQRRAGAHFHSPGLNHSHESSRPVWQRQSFVIWFAHQPDVDADAQAAREPDDRDGRQSVSQDVRTSGHQEARKPGGTGPHKSSTQPFRPPFRVNVNSRPACRLLIVKIMSQLAEKRGRNGGKRTCTRTPAMLPTLRRLLWCSPWGIH